MTWPPGPGPGPSAPPPAHGGPPPPSDTPPPPPGYGAGSDHDLWAPGGRSGPAPVRLGYAVDIVFVIDITGSMGPVLAQVKAGAITFHDRLMKTMRAKGKQVNELRLRIVAYRDFYAHHADALMQTPFLRLPAETHSFNRFVHGLHAGGGWDEPESGLEGLAVAMQSDWQRGMDRRRHVVVLFTDASAHPLEAAHGRAIPGYPPYIPQSLSALSDAWDDPHHGTMEFSAKRLLLYAPDVYPWDIISSSWDNVLHYPSIAGQGLSELEFGQIVDAIAGSV